jgi:two-component sensor histidine kinase
VRIIGAAQDITKSKNAEEQIQKNLREKEILLKEIYHRVKNNLNVITSLLNLQSSKIQTKEEALEAFRESRDRVFAMALIHEKLYMSEDFARVDMKSYIESMIQELFYIHKVEPSITLDIQVQDVYLDINTAIPCGLILNELVTNIFKYAFPDKRKGTLQIVFSHKKEGKYQLIVHDNGIGLPWNMDIEKVESLGLQLVQMLTKQIDGVLKINRNDGTHFQITFPTKKS